MTGEAAPRRVGPRLRGGFGDGRGGFGKFAGDSTKGTGMAGWLTVDTATDTILCAAEQKNRSEYNPRRPGRQTDVRIVRALRERGKNVTTIRL